MFGSTTHLIGCDWQVHAGEILTELTSRVPVDAFCVAALTLCDLYPRDSWNYVFGLARLNAGVGVYSLARYTPGFWDDTEETDMENLSR